jgi:hypothetical protein
MKKLLGITLVAAFLLVGGLSFGSKKEIADPGTGGLKRVSYDPGAGGLSAKKVVAYDPGAGGL